MFKFSIVSRATLVLSLDLQTPACLGTGRRERRKAQSFYCQSSEKAWSAPSNHMTMSKALLPQGVVRCPPLWEAVLLVWARHV